MLGNADTRVVEDMCRATAVGVTNHVGLLRRRRASSNIVDAFGI